jgi:hypothetical protein
MTAVGPKIGRGDLTRAQSGPNNRSIIGGTRGEARVQLFAIIIPQFGRTRAGG